MYLTFQDIQQFRENHRLVFENEMKGAKTSIESFLDSRQRLVNTFSLEKEKLLQKFSQDVENEELRLSISESLRRWFPTYFTFTLADKNGVDLVDDIEGFIGDVCLANIQHFVNDFENAPVPKEHRSSAVIHPQALNYHFDIMAPRKYEGTLQGVFFVSFYPDIIQSILKSYESEGHNLFVTNLEQEGLIEVSSEGARDKISSFREIQLSATEMENVISSKEIKHSLWKIVAIPDEALFRDYSISQWTSAAIIIFGLTLMTLFSIRVTSRLEKKRKTSHDLLLASQDDLKKRVTDLYESRELISKQAEELTDVLEKEYILRAETDRLYKSKSQFLATMSHEIRTPMAGIIGLANLMINSKIPKQQWEWATSIKSAAENLIQILNEILDQSKLESGKIELFPTDFKIEFLLRDTQKLFESVAADKGTSLEIEIDSQCPKSVKADKLRIGQILNNLIGNALKFTNEGAVVIHLKHELIDENFMWLEFSVKDTGIGISEDSIKNLFQSYAQADNSISSKYGGTGLGLSISKQLTELMEGEIGVSSVENVGSTFWFKVKCERTKQSIGDPFFSATETKWGASRPLRILIAEDNSIIQQVIKGLLSKFDHELHFVNDGNAAIDKAITEEFDVILMDIRMPGIDGFEATSTIREKETNTTPIIALSADVKPSDFKLYQRAGMNEACTKPIDLNDLLPKINKVIGEDIHFINITENEQKNNSKKLVIENQEEPTKQASNDLLLEQRETIPSNQTPIDNLSGKIDDSVFLNIVALFEAETLEKCEELLASLSSSPSHTLVNSDLLQSVRGYAHILKGQGGSLSYPLITSVATNISETIKNQSEITEQELRLIIRYLEAIKFILVNKLSDSGGDDGKALMDDLTKNLKISDP